jgi:hypothetical protein
LLFRISACQFIFFSLAIIITARSFSFDAPLPNFPVTTTDMTTRSKRRRLGQHSGDELADSLATSNAQGPQATPVTNDETIGIEPEDEAPSSSNSSPQVTPPEAANVPALEDIYEARPLELIPRLIARDLQKEDAGEVVKDVSQLADLVRLQANGDTSTEDKTNQNRKSIFEYGGHTSLLLSFQRFPDSEGVLLESCRAIGSLLLQKQKHNM